MTCSPTGPLACRLALATLALALGAGVAQAADGKLLLTGGVASIDGAAGGGLTPWAVTGSYATRGQVGGTAHLTAAKTQDYALLSYGAAFSWNERIELSLARQEQPRATRPRRLEAEAGHRRREGARRR
jgi:Protein of unknown function (DUF3034)